MCNTILSNFMKWKFTLFMFLSLFLSQAYGSFKTTLPGKVVEEGAGYSVLYISDKEYKEAFAKAGASDSTSDVSGILGKPEEGAFRLYVLESWQGVINSTLPAHVKNELLEDAGGNIYKRPVDDGTIILVNEKNFASFANDVDPLASENMQNKFSASENSQDKSFGFSCKKWYATSKTFSKNINNIVKGEKIEDEGFTGNYEANMNSRGKITLDVSVRYKINRCVSTSPYKIELKRAKIQGELFMDNATFRMNGTAFKYHDTLFTQEIGMYNWSKYFCVWWFCFDAAAHVKFDVGVDLDSQIDYTVGYNAKINGYMKFDYRCTVDGCVEAVPTVSDISFDGWNGEPVTSVSGHLTLKPWFLVEAGASLSLYVRYLEILEGRAKLEIIAPLKIYGYAGNDCQDGDNDGRNESIKALFLDFNVGAAFYMEFELFNGNDAVIPLKLNLPGWLESKKCGNCIRFDLKEKYEHAVAKHLYFYDLLSGGSTMFSPVVREVRGTVKYGVPSSNSLVAVGSRSCSPFSDAISYEIDWGNGLFTTVDAGKTPVTTPILGNPKQIVVKPKSDSAGRTFQPTSTTFRFGAVGLPEK